MNKQLKNGIDLGKVNQEVHRSLTAVKGLEVYFIQDNTIIRGVIIGIKTEVDRGEYLVQLKAAYIDSEGDRRFKWAFPENLYQDPADAAECLTFLNAVNL